MVCLALAVTLAEGGGTAKDYRYEAGGWEDTQALFGKTPTDEECVYFIYLYYFRGNNGGKDLLAEQAKLSPKPSFEQVISNTVNLMDQTKNAFKVYYMYRTVKAAGILPGYP